MPRLLEITLKGWGDLEKALKTIGPRSARRGGAKALRHGADQIIEKAKELVPVDTGALEESIVYVAEASRSGQTLLGQIGFRRGPPSMARRATFIEYGTVKMAAQPFMRPAIDLKGRAAVSVIGQTLWEAIEKEADLAKKGTPD